MRATVGGRAWTRYHGASMTRSPESSSVDPLSDVVALLRPRTVLSKCISGAGRWGVRYSPFGQPSFCAILEGSCRLLVDGHRPLTLAAGDFVLLPATPGFTMTGFTPVTPRRFDAKAEAAAGVTAEVRHGTPTGPPVSMTASACSSIQPPQAAIPRPMSSGLRSGALAFCSGEADPI